MVAEAIGTPSAAANRVVEAVSEEKAPVRRVQNRALIPGALAPLKRLLILLEFLLTAACCRFDGLCSSLRPLVKMLENIDPLAAGPQPEGTFEAFNQKYAYKGPSQTSKWLEVMSFGCEAGAEPNQSTTPHNRPVELPLNRSAAQFLATAQGGGAGGCEQPSGDAGGCAAPSWGVPGQRDRLAAGAGRCGDRPRRLLVK